MERTLCFFFVYTLTRFLYKIRCSSDVYAHTYIVNSILMYSEVMTSCFLLRECRVLNCFLPSI